jgi:uncharacterized membrane protein required for colicin V production
MNLPSLRGNWVDLVILLIIIYFASEAFRIGFWSILANFISFLASLVVALWGFQYASHLLQSNFDIARSMSNAIGFFLIAIIFEGMMGYLTFLAVTKLPSSFTKKWWGKILAIVPGMGEGIVLVSFALTLFLALPIYPNIKSDITNSKIGGSLVSKTTILEARLDEILGGVIEDSLTYFTINPESHEVIPIITDRLELREEPEVEKKMFDLVNKERSDRGIAELDWYSEVVLVARVHATDMWERSYFGHVSPEGYDVGDRLEVAGINYTFAGENLAMAPTLITAHNGLMGSPGHRANILEPKFKRGAIGVIDNGVYGKMFVQVFTD